MVISQKRDVPILSATIERALLVIGALLVSALVLEGVLRLLGLSYANIPLDPDHVYHRVHPKNHRYVSFSGTGDYGGFPVYFDTNGFIADPAGAQNSTSTGALIAFLGDSFTEGYQVPYEETFFSLLTKSFPDTRLRNYGVAAYSSTLNYLQWKNILKVQKPKFVFLLAFWQFIPRDNDYATHAYFGPNGDIIGVDGGEPNFATRFARSSNLIRFVRKVYLQARWGAHRQSGGPLATVAGYVEENPDIEGSFTEKYILKMNEEMKKNGTTLVLLGVPSQYNDYHGFSNAHTEFSEKVERFAKKNTIPFLDLVGPFHRLRIETGTSNFHARDIHFNEQGNRVVAEVIRTFLRTNLSKGGQPEQ